MAPFLTTMDFAPTPKKGLTANGYCREEGSRKSRNTCIEGEFEVRPVVGVGAKSMSGPEWRHLNVFGAPKTKKKLWAVSPPKIKFKV
jgi:hypothetical protein